VCLKRLGSERESGVKKYFPESGAGFLTCVPPRADNLFGFLIELLVKYP
jgi:hypothetical protein